MTLRIPDWIGYTLVGTIGLTIFLLAWVYIVTRIIWLLKNRNVYHVALAWMTFKKEPGAFPEVDLHHVPQRGLRSLSAFAKAQPITVTSKNSAGA